ncbi:TPA: hypothetical protein U5D59_004443, partial [Yersinia enterocolitica]|nr:hypothetical protein [Yersinia enterocolitica]
MNRTDDPKKQPIPFGVNGPREDIGPTTPTGDNSASYNSGFPPITMLLKAAGGLPPKGQDMNQILFELSALSRWFSAGAIASYDSIFSTAIGGYPKGAEVLGSDFVTRYFNTVDANTSNPNTGGAGWFNLTTGYLQTENNLSDLTNVTTALANLGFGQSVARDGYLILPGGLIMQWGTLTGDQGNLGAGYPIAFKERAFQALTSMNDKTAGAVDGITLYVPTANLANKTSLIVLN